MSALNAALDTLPDKSGAEKAQKGKSMSAKAAVEEPLAPELRAAMDAGLKDKVLNSLLSFWDVLEILQAVPGSALASDQHYRLADLAIDFCEDVEPLPEASVMKIVSLFEGAGARAKVSSIHVNGWFGDYDKLSMAKTLFAREFGLELQANNPQALFIGDSPNDEPMFEFFSYSVGVANIQKQLHRLTHRPKFVTPSEGGTGFVEMARWLLLAHEMQFQ